MDSAAVTPASLSLPQPLQHNVGGAEHTAATAQRPSEQAVVSGRMSVDCALSGSMALCERADRWLVG